MQGGGAGFPLREMIRQRRLSGGQRQPLCPVGTGTHALSPPRKKVTVKTPCCSFLASLLPGENASVCSSYWNRMMGAGRRDKSPAATGRTDFSMK